MNTIDFIKTLNDDAVKTFRGLAAISFEANKGLKGETRTVFTGNKNVDIFGTDQAAVYGLKFIANQDDNKKVIGGSMLVQTTLDKAPLDLAIPMNFMSAIPDGIDCGPNGHLRWRTSAPPTVGNLYQYLTHKDQCLVIDPKTLKLDSKAIDIQTVFVGGFYHVHILTEGGMVYEAKINAHDVRTNGRLPTFQKLKLENKVTAVLTVPQNGELVAFFGTANDGVYFGSQQIPGTNRLAITDLVVDSEKPRMFITTDQGKIYGLGLNHNFMLHGELTPIDDVMTYGERIFAGAAVNNDEDTIALLAIQWVAQGNGSYAYSERKIPVPQMFATIPDINGLLV